MSIASLTMNIFAEDSYKLTGKLVCFNSDPITEKSSARFFQFVQDEEGEANEQSVKKLEKSEA
uniref:Uncharacterized protein n=1 Tax=Romanomermis culicivorax TaxID=13658 RepID=A0A915K8H9_ROMCU